VWPARGRAIPRIAKTIQDLLGHSTIVTTADTYMSVLPDVQRRCADATAALVLAAAWHIRKRIKEKAARNRPAGRDEKQTPSGTTPGGKRKTRSSQARRRANRRRMRTDTYVPPT
jgi:hypothetical protein